MCSNYNFQIIILAKIIKIQINLSSNPHFNIVIFKLQLSNLNIKHGSDEF